MQSISQLLPATDATIARKQPKMDQKGMGIAVFA